MSVLEINAFNGSTLYAYSFHGFFSYFIIIFRVCSRELHKSWRQPYRGIDQKEGSENEERSKNEVNKAGKEKERGRKRFRYKTAYSKVQFCIHINFTQTQREIFSRSSQLPLFGGNEKLAYTCNFNIFPVMIYAGKARKNMYKYIF